MVMSNNPRKYTLEELVAQMRLENETLEISMGAEVGSEVVEDDPEIEENSDEITQKKY